MRETSTSTVPDLSSAADPTTRRSRRPWKWNAPSTRLTGLDIARAVAVIGMFMQHFFTPPGGVQPLSLFAPASWWALVNNNSTVLFALLAGISKALIDGGRVPPMGTAALQARTNIIGRGIALFLVSGILVTFISTPGSVLGYIAAGFIISTPFLRVPPSRLFAYSAVGLVAIPYPVHVLTEFVASRVETVGADNSVDLLVTGLCPALIFFPVFLIGIAIGRCDLRSTAVQFRLFVVGVVVAAASYLGSWLFTESFGTLEWTRSSVVGAFALPDWRIEYAVTTSHLNGILQMTVGVGVASTVIGSALALASLAGVSKLLFPLRALGMCAFTAYILQFVAVVAVFGTDPMNYMPTNVFFFTLTGALILGASLWLSVFRRGPFEWLLNGWARYLSRIGPDEKLARHSPNLTPAYDR